MAQRETVQTLLARLEAAELRIEQLEKAARHDAHDINELYQRVTLGPSYVPKTYDGK